MAAPPPSGDGTWAAPGDGTWAAPGGPEAPAGVPQFLPPAVGGPEQPGFGGGFAPPPPDGSWTGGDAGAGAPSGSLKDRLTGRPPLLVGGVAALVVVLLGAFLVLGRGGGGGGGGDVLSDGRYFPPSSGPAKEPDSKARWDERIDCEIDCSVLADDKRVYVLSSDEDGDSRLIAFDGGSGKELWDQRVDGTRINLVMGTILVGDYDRTAGHDPVTGKRLWRSRGWYTGVVSGQDVLLQTYDGDDSEYRAVRVSDGDERFSADGSMFGACKGVVYSFDDDDLIATDARSGDEIWKARLDDASGAGCGDSGVFAVDDGEVRSFEPQSGKERWAKRVKGALGISVIESVVMARADDSEEIIGLSASDGKELWSVDGDEWDLYALPVGNGLAIADSADDDGLTLIDVKQGKDVRSIRFDSRVVAVTTSAIHTLDDDEVEALEARSLNSRWKFDVDSDWVDVAVGGGRLYVVTDDSISAYR